MSLVSGTMYGGRRISSISTSAMPRSFIAFSRSRRWRTPMMCSGVSR